MHSRLGVEIVRSNRNIAIQSQAQSLPFVRWLVCFFFLFLYFWFENEKSMLGTPNSTVRARESSVRVFALKGQTVVELMNERIQSNKWSYT